MGAWVLAAILALGLLWYFVSGPGAGSGSHAYFRYLPRLSKASTSRIPDGFPVYYVLGARPEVTKASKTTNTNTKLDVYRVATTVASDPRAVFNEYLEFFTKTDWIIRAQYLGTSAGSITAEKERSTVVVTFVPSTRTTRVTIQYQTPHTAQ